MSWQPKTLGQFLENNARGQGAAEALVTATGRFTYEELFEKAKGVAGAI